MQGDRLRTQVLDYLQRHNTMTIATCAGREPWAAAVFYVNDGFLLYFLSDPGSDHCRQLTDNPTVALTIHEDYRDWREIKGLQIRGVAELLADEAEIREAWRLYLAKYPFVADWQRRLAHLPGVAGLLELAGAAGAARRLDAVRFYRVRALRVLYTDNARGFGHREELLVAGIDRLSDNC